MLARCSAIQTSELTRPLTDEDRALIKKKNDDFASRGLRVLALAFRSDEETQSMREYNAENCEENLVFLGLAAMSDPVRPQVPDAIRACHAAGIRVIMITGDYALTAQSIGRKIGLGGEGELPVFAGSEIAALSDEQLQEKLKSGETVFARVSPDQKLRIVTLLRNLGEIVAVTGDGVNDGPALKRADIGIAMGLRGTDVAKEAAQIILTDDNFASIAAAIEEGRAIFENIKRFAAYVLSSNPQEMYPYIIWMLFPGTPLAMTVMGVLAVDVGTDLIPAMGLGIEPPEKGIMERAPRRKDEKLLSVGFILRNYFIQGSILAFACYATYYYFAWTLGLPILTAPPSPANLDMNLASFVYLQSLTAYFFPTVSTQIGNVMCRRSWKASLFSREFLSPYYREQILNGIKSWKPQRYTATIRIQSEFSKITDRAAWAGLGRALSGLILFPVRFVRVLVQDLMVRLYGPVIRPLQALAFHVLSRQHVLLNLLSNPLINLGIAFELLLCWLFFYTGLSEIYYFAPVPWHVYLFAFHGTLLIVAFEETRKFFLRKGFFAQ